MLSNVCLSDDILLSVETVYKKLTEELLILEERYRNYIGLNCQDSEGIIRVYICIDNVIPKLKNIKVKKNIHLNYDIHFRIIDSETMFDIFFSSGLFFYDLNYIKEDNKKKLKIFIEEVKREEKQYTERMSNIDRREEYRKKQKELKRKDFFKEKEVVENLGFFKSIIKKIKDTLAIFKI